MDDTDFIDARQLTLFPLPPPAAQPVVEDDEEDEHEGMIAIEVRVFGDDA